MITVLTGENSFEIHEALQAIISSFKGQPERIDGSSLELKALPDLLMGSTLFATERLVIVKDLSENKAVWEKLPEWLPRLSDDIHLVLVDAKLDKRTTTYKELKKLADVKECHNWTDRERSSAENWVVTKAKSAGLTLDKKLSHQIVERVGFDQWQLASAIEKLSLLDEVTSDVIEATIDASPTENVFALFETALEGQARKLHDIIRTLELTEDPYQTFALLSSQAFQLLAVAAAKAGDNPTKDFAIHPYVASKLSRHAQKRGAHGAGKIVKLFAQTDADLKLSKAEPWLLIERTLMGVAAL